MEKNCFFAKRLGKYSATKIFFVAFVLLNICSSVFHLYYSRENTSNPEIHLEGNIIVFNSSKVENTDISTPIHLEGNALLYDKLDSQNTDASKKILISRNEKVDKHKSLSKTKKFRHQKSKTYINCLDFESGISQSSLISRNFALNTQNFHPKLAFSDNLRVRIYQLNFRDKKLSNKLFPEEKESSFFKRYFGRPPPFLV